MRVRMIHQQSYQDAGQERPLRVGQVYDLPDGVAESLVATGAAEQLAEPLARPRMAPETVVTAPPETKRHKREPVGNVD